jgi:hypothetical protein
MNGVIQVSEFWNESTLTLAITFLFIAMLTDKQSALLQNRKFCSVFL